MGTGFVEKPLYIDAAAIVESSRCSSRQHISIPLLYDFKEVGRIKGQFSEDGQCELSWSSGDGSVTHRQLIAIRNRLGNKPYIHVCCPKCRTWCKRLYLIPKKRDFRDPSGVGRRYRFRCATCADVRRHRKSAN